jgi:hypothetical protein
MEATETLQQLEEEFSETMLYEFADNECAPGNRLVFGHLMHKGYSKEQIEVLRSVVKMDTQKNGW